MKINFDKTILVATITCFTSAFSFGMNPKKSDKIVDINHYLKCEVLSQDNDVTDGVNPDYQKITQIEINTRYSPLNVVLNGTSLNEQLMLFGADPIEDYEEIAFRTKKYMKVGVNNLEESLEAEMDNDWDTYMLHIDIRTGYDGFYRGIISLEWGDSYYAFVKCTRHAAHS